MKYRDLINNTQKAIVDLPAATGPAYTPNLDHGSIFRIVDTVDVTLNNPTYLKDGLYIRIEIATGVTNTITFGSIYTIDGVAMSPVTNSSGLYILEGRYSDYLEKFLMRVV